MKNPALGVLFLILILPAQCHAEDLALHFDGREWELGYKAKNNEQGIQEYIPKGEKVENWSELVTVQVFFGAQEKVTSEQFMDNVIKGLKAVCPNLVINVVSKSDKDILLDWEAANIPGQSDQYEIDRVISGKDAIWYLRYVTRKLPVPPDKRSEWKRLLGSAVLQN